MYSDSSTAAGYNAAFSRFMKTVFNYMSGGVALSGVVAYLTFNNPQLLAAAANPVTQIIFLVIWFGFGFFAHKIIRKVPTAVGLMLFVGFPRI